MIDPAVHDLLLLLLKWVTVALVAHLCVPALLSALGLAMYRNGVHGGPADVYPDGSDAAYGDIYNQLISLGFEPLGIHWEQTFGFPRFRRFEERMFRARRGDVLAAITRLFGSCPTVNFLSVFTSGGAILTANYEKTREEENDYLTQGILSGRLDEVLAEHRVGLERFVAAGQVPRTVSMLEELEDLERVYFRHPAVQRSYRREARQMFLTYALLVGLVPGMTWLGSWVWGWADATIPWLVQFGFAAWIVGLDHGLRRRIKRELAAQQTEVRQHGAAQSCDSAASPQLVAEFRDAREKMIDSLLIQMRCGLADAFADWLLPRPWAFDVERGWLKKGQEVDFVQTVYCPARARKTTQSEQDVAIAEERGADFPPADGGVDYPSANSLGRRGEDESGPETRRRLGPTPLWKWSADDAQRFKARLVLPVILDQLAAGLVNAIKFVVVCTALNLVALWARGGGVGLLGNNRTLSVLVLFGLVGLLSAVLFAISVPSMFAGFASQLGQFKRTVEGDPMLEFRYPGTAADHNQEPIRCLIPLKELADGAFVAHGVAQFWHVNGQPAAEVPFHEGQADGSFTLWHSNGQKKSEGYWSGGRKADRWQYWNSDGLPIATVEYEFDVLLDGRSPYDSACDLRSYHWAAPLLLDPNLPPKRLREAFTKNRRPLAGWWSECSASATG